MRGLSCNVSEQKGGLPVQIGMLAQKQTRREKVENTIRRKISASHNHLRVLINIAVVQRKREDQ